MTPEPASPSKLRPEEQLHEALRRRDATALRALFDAHPGIRSTIDEPVFSFNAPAIVAFTRDPAIVEVLLDHGADPDRRSDWWAGGFHALHVATGRSAELLLAAGAEIDACAAANLDRVDLLTDLIDQDPARVMERGGDGQTPLHFARSKEVADLLLEAGAEIDARDVDHRSTPAEWMLDGGPHRRYDLARYLVVERGASADIFMAAALGLAQRAVELVTTRTELLRARTGRGEWGETPPSSHHIYMWSIGDGRSPLDVARQFGQGETLDAMLAIAPAVDRLLHYCGQGDAVRARQLLREEPGLVSAIPGEEHRLLADAAWAGNRAAVALMLDVGFDPTAPGHDSGSALHCAAWRGSPDVVELLLGSARARAAIDATDARYGATPLGWCCHGSRFGPHLGEHAKVASLLLDAGANVGPDCREAALPVARVIADRASPGRRVT